MLHCANGNACLHCDRLIFLLSLLVDCGFFPLADDVTSTTVMLSFTALLANAAATAVAALLLLVYSYLLVFFHFGGNCLLC